MVFVLSGNRTQGLSDRESNPGKAEFRRAWNTKYRQKFHKICPVKHDFMTFFEEFCPHKKSCIDVDIVDEDGSIDIPSCSVVVAIQSILLCQQAEFASRVSF